jgi:hypothetical protein
VAQIAGANPDPLVNRDAVLRAAAIAIVGSAW